MSVFSTMISMPAWDEFARVFMLRDYNTRVVVAGTTLLGVAAGMVGTFLLLRRRALLSDAVSHATLPGIALAFLGAVWLGWDPKSLPILLTGAAITAGIGMLAVATIRDNTRLKDDAALGIVLSVSYAAGIALLGLIQKLEGTNAAGLKSFIYGKTASMLFFDSMLIGVVALLAAVSCGLLFKEFALLSFDADFGATQGYPTKLLDLALMSLAVIVTVVGLQAVGLILVVAMLVVPAAAARFWSHDLRIVFVVAAVLGGVSGLTGSMISTLFARMPAGAIIVLVTAALFVLSLLFGTQNGLIVRWWSRRSLTRRVSRQHLLRSMFELTEAKTQHGWAPNNAHTSGELLAHRAWTPSRLTRLLHGLEHDGFVREDAEGRWEFTQRGETEAREITTNHRMWELYLIMYADIAPSHVDRDADMIEHVLDKEMIVRLRARLRGEYPGESSEQIVASPHTLVGAGPNVASSTTAADKSSQGGRS